METMDEQRGFWEFVPAIKMPKAFLMSAKRRHTLDTLCAQEEYNADERNVSPVSETSEHMSSDAFEDDDNEAPLKKSAKIYPSTGSAFSKIKKSEGDTRNDISPYYQSTPQTPPGFPGMYSGFYPSLFSYPFGSISSETGGSVKTPFGGSYLYPPSSLQSPSEKRETTSPDRNMFYYVDPRIPFTNYFLNLTKLLSTNSSSKTCSATTPLGKIADEENRADDRDHPISPESHKLIEKESEIEKTNRLFPKSSAELTTEFPIKKELKIDVVPEKMNIPTFPDHHNIANPFGSHLLHASHQGPLLPMHGGGIFHPSMMSIPGASGYRRFNPEKPPPVKKYKCDVCGKAFSRSNTLVTHKRIHTGDKPFKCEVCSRAFRQPGNLTRHRLTHTTVKPYVCPTCNKAFNRASNLHTHMRTHTSFKAFVCPYCGKGFHQKIDMKIHCYTHTAHSARGDLPKI